MDTAVTVVRDPTRSAVPVGVAVVLAWLVMAAGVGAIVTSLSNAVVDAPVEIGLPAPARSHVVLPCIEGWSLDGASGCAPAADPEVWPGGAPLPAQQAGGIEGLVAGVDSSRASTVTTILAASPMWASLLAGGLVLLLLIPVIRSTAEGRPFASGNSRRWAVSTAIVAGGWAVAAIGPYFAARQIIPVLESTPQYVTAAGEAFTLPAGWLVADLRIVWWPLLVIALLAVLAAATHRGARLAADTEGLV